MKVKSESEVAQSCPTVCMDYSLPGSSVHGNFQARVLEWVVISFSRGSSWPRDRTQLWNWTLLHFPHWQVDSSPLCHPVQIYIKNSKATTTELRAYSSYVRKECNWNNQLHLRRQGRKTSNREKAQWITKLQTWCILSQLYPKSDQIQILQPQ